MVSVRGADVPPWLAGLTTVIGAVPRLATRLALTDACSVVTDAYVVVRAVPFHAMAEFVLNPLPTTVSVKAPFPAGTVAGNKEVRAKGGNGWMTRLAGPDGALPETGSSMVIV